MKQIDMSNIKEASEPTRLPAGAYICTICNVEDFPDREYLKVTYDIAQGDYRGYYKSLRDEHPDWSWVGSYVKSYKQKALPMLKRFCSAVSKSNNGFVFDGGAVNSDEKTLIGKSVGLVLREEEYYRNDGEKSTKLTVFKEFPIDKLNEQKVPDVKRLEDPALGTPSAVGDGFMDIPFDNNNGMAFS